MTGKVIRFVRKIVLPIGVFRTALLCLLAALFLALQVACGHPSDARLAERFRAHETEFDELVRMSEVDNQIYRIAPEFIVPEKALSSPEFKFSQRRWDDYRSRFRRLSISNGIVRAMGGEPVWFTASAEGMFGRGSSKGYVYSRTRLSPCVTDLEGYDPPASAVDANYHYIVYKELKENWYLYYEFR